MLRLLHPVLFYPLALLAAGLIIFFGLEPQRWSRPPAPVAGAATAGGLVFSGDALGRPAPDPVQPTYVARDFFGRTESLRVAVQPGQPDPRAADQGVRILLEPETAALIENRPTLVEVTYNTLPFTTAHELAVSIQGAGPTTWVKQALPNEPGSLRFELPPQSSVSAIGIRAMGTQPELAYGLEITQVRVVPRR